MPTIDIYDKTLVEMGGFLGTMEPCISSWGGRQYRVVGDQSQKTLALKEIIQVVEQKCRQEQRSKAPLTILAAIKRLDRQGDEMLKRSSLIIRILTFIRQFFGNLRFNKTQHVENLVQADLATEDTRFLIDAFNRNPNTYDAATGLVVHLTVLAQIAHLVHWNGEQLLGLAEQFNLTCPGKMQAILTLPDNEFTIPLKANLNRFIVRIQPELTPPMPPTSTIEPTPLQEENQAAVEGVESDLKRDFNEAAEQYNDIIERQISVSRWGDNIEEMIWRSNNANADSEIWLNLLRKYDFSEKLMGRIFSYIRHANSIAKIINLVRINPHTECENEMERILPYIKKKNRTAYISILRELVFLEKDFHPTDMNCKMPELNDSEFGQLFRSIQAAILKLTLNRAKLTPFSKERVAVENGMRKLFSWLRRLENENVRNEERIDHVKRVIKVVIHELKEEQEILSAIHSMVLEEWRIWKMEDKVPGVFDDLFAEYLDQLDEEELY